MLRLGNAPIALHIPQQELSAANASSSHALAAVFQKKTFAENYTNPTQVALSSPASACAMNRSQLVVHLNHQHTRALAPQSIRASSSVHKSKLLLIFSPVRKYFLIGEKRFCHWWQKVLPLVAKSIKPYGLRLKDMVSVDERYVDCG